jgi:quercetin dioxygenase-like cupin family protein
LKNYKADFGSIEWEIPFEGVRHKYLDQDGQRLRLVEYSKEMPPHWCEKGHYGYVISGQMEIEFDYKKEIYKSGDGVILPAGAEYRHKAKVISDKVLVFFVERF